MKKFDDKKICLGKNLRSNEDQGLLTPFTLQLAGSKIKKSIIFFAQRVAWKREKKKGRKKNPEQTKKLTHTKI